MTPVNNVIRLDNKHQPTYNSWGKGWDKEVPVFHLSISNSQYTQAFFWEWLQGIWHSWILVELKTMYMFACRNRFYKINKSTNSTHEILKYWKYSKRREETFDKKLNFVMIRGKLTKFIQNSFVNRICVANILIWKCFK